MPLWTLQQVGCSRNTWFANLSRIGSIPSAGGVLREADRARKPESKVRVWSRSLDPIDSIGQLLSITVRRNTPAEGISWLLRPSHVYRRRAMTYVMEKLSMSASLLANFHLSMASHRRVEFDRTPAIEYALSRSYRLCKAGLR